MPVGVVGLFEPAGGQQIGISWAVRQNIINWQLAQIEPYTYKYGTIIGSQHTRLGMGRLSAEYLRLLLANQNQKGVKVVSEILAKGEDRQVVRRMLTGIGAKQTKKAKFHFVLETWVEEIPHQPLKPKDSLMITDLGVRLNSQTLPSLIGLQTQSEIARRNHELNQLEILPLGGEPNQIGDVKTFLIQAKTLGHRIFLKTPFTS